MQYSDANFSVNSGLAAQNLKQERSESILQRPDIATFAAETRCAAASSKAGYANFALPVTDGTRRGVHSSSLVFWWPSGIFRSHKERFHVILHTEGAQRTQQLENSSKSLIRLRIPISLLLAGRVTMLELTEAKSGLDDDEFPVRE